MPLGSLLYLRVWHDNSGDKGKASWFLNMINVMNLQTGEKFVLIFDFFFDFRFSIFEFEEIISFVTIGWPLKKAMVLLIVLFRLHRKKN